MTVKRELSHEPLDRLQHHQLVLRGQFVADGGRLQQHRQRQYARIFDRGRQPRDQLLRRRRRRLGEAHRQRRSRRAGCDLDGAGGGAAGDRQWARFPRRHGRRQLLGLDELRDAPEWRFALGDARQSSERADDLRGLADLVVRRRRCGNRGAEPRPVAQRGRRRRQPGARASRSEHGGVGLDHQFAARPLQDRQRHGRQRAGLGRQRRRRRGHPRFAPDPARA